MVSLFDGIARLAGYQPVAAPAPASPSTKEKKGGPRKAKKRGSWNQQTSPIAMSQTRWTLASEEQILAAADSGQLQPLGRFCEALRGNGLIAGILLTRTAGLFRLPVLFSGDEELCAELKGTDGDDGAFARMAPVTELCKLTRDGILGGQGIGEMVESEEDPGGDPVLHTLDPQWLSYQHSTDQWFYTTATGREEVIPGDGRWVLHLPYGSERPWTEGSWRQLCEPFVSRKIATLDRGRYSGSLAQGIRVATVGKDATDRSARQLLQQLQDMARNAVAVLREGQDIKMVESNGRGFEVWTKMRAEAGEEFMIALAGQVVTTQGSTGFGEGNIFADIKADLIQDTAEKIASTIHRQILAPWVMRKRGAEAVARTPWARWDVTPPSAKKAKAETMAALGDGISKADKALEPHGLRVKVAELATTYELPTEQLPAPPPPAAPALPAAQPDTGTGAP